MLFPVLPLFITGVLGAPVGAVSIVEGVADGVSSLLKGVSGRLADQFPRRPLVFLGYGIAAMAKGLIALATSWPFVLFCRTVDRIGKGLRTSPRDALISVDTTEDDRGRAFGFHRAMDSVGSTIGPLIGLGLYEALHHQLRLLFAIAVIPALVSVYFIRFVREAPPAAKAASVRFDWDFPRRYWGALGVLTLFSAANFSNALIIVRLQELGFSFASIFVAYALYNAAYAGLSYPAGRLSDRIPRRYVFAIGLIALTLSFTGFALTSEQFFGWLLFVVYGVFMAFTDGVGTAWIAGLVQQERVGTGLGLYYACTGFATIGAGVWAGFLWGTDGHIPFTVTACVAALVAGVLGLWRPPSASKDQLLLADAGDAPS